MEKSSRAKILKTTQYKDKWITPPGLWKKLDDEFHFDVFDPCPIDWEEGSPDGLEMEWAQTSFVNPPFSEIGKWIEKADKEWRKAKTIVMVMPMKTNIAAFHDVVLRGPVEIRFIRGRINFLRPDGKKSTNPFPNLILIWRKERWAALEMQTSAM